MPSPSPAAEFVRLRPTQPQATTRRWWRHALAATAAALSACAGTAQATWSIVLVDTRTGEVALGSATCLTGFDLRANTPVLLTGVGGATAQSQADTNGVNRAFIRDGLLTATPPSQILTGLLTFDSPNGQRRQYGIADVLGRAATFSGTLNGTYAGGQTGRIGDIVYAIQGNVITGPCMVQAAVDAVVSTPGDLAAKLMAGMEAARAMGGDGRCSCTPDGADSCGCPPLLAFTRSSYIAYMLVGRAGDIDGCNGIYRAGTATGALGISDMNGDGRVDLLSCNSTSNQLAILRNTTIPFATAPTIGGLTSSATGAIPQSVIAADIDADGRPDAIVANGGPGTLSYFRNTGGGSFAPRVDLTAGASPRSLVSGNFDATGRPGVAALIPSTNSITLFRNNNAGGFVTPASTIALGSGASPVAMIAADLDSNGTSDLAVTLNARSALAMLSGQGDGTFTRLPDIALGSLPGQLAAADFDRDGKPDMAVSLSSRFVRILLRRGDGYVATNLLLPSVPLRMIAADVTGDGAPDLLTLTGGALQILVNDGIGSFSLGPSSAVNANGTDLVSADFDNPPDGLHDVMVSSSLGVVVLKNTGGKGPGGVGTGPRFAAGPGCATGNYWMNFNVANAQATDADPVLALRTQFDAWRAVQVGRVDAVRSTATLDRTCLRADGRSAATLTIEPRDYTGLRSSAPLVSVRVEHARSSARLAVLGTPVINPDGRITVSISTPSFRSGVDRLDITLDDGVRPIVLMPAPTVVIGLNADYDASGTVEAADVAAFLSDYFTDPAPTASVEAPGLGQPCPGPDGPATGYRADFNRDCFIPDQEDLSAFITAFLEGC